MKKFAKMSLVAAVAVAGLSSNVSAQPLADAIQNVTISGSIAMKYDDRYQTDEAEGQNLKQTVFKTIAVLKSKINDDMTARVTAVSRSADTTSTNGNDLGLSHVNFIYSGVENATFIIGKQAFDTPFTDPADPIDGADSATGITGIYKAGPATLIAAYYSTNTTAVSDNDVSYLAAIAQAGPVKIDAHYIDLGNGQGGNAFEDGADFIKVGLSGKAGPVKLAANYASLDSDTSGAETQKTWNISASGKVGAFGLSIKHAQNDEDGGAVTLEHDAAMDFQGWAIAINKISAPQYDNKATIAAISYPLSDSMNLKVYGGVNDYETAAGVEVDEDEIVAQFSHSLSKNFSYYIRFGQFNKDTDGGTDDSYNRGRIYGAYKF